MTQTTAVSAANKRLAREYELVYILKPNTDPDEADRVATRVQDVVARLGGKITKVDVWGRRKLAYTIQKVTRGVFVYIKVVGFNDLVAELERNLRIADSVIRFQTIRREETHEDLNALVVDPEDTKFTRIEAPPSEDEPEPSFEERLGLTLRQRERHDEDLLPDDDDDTTVGGVEIPSLNDDEPK